MEEIVPQYISVKEAVFPFTKFREFDPILGPEMRSTGEVMGVAESFGQAFAKAQLAADNRLPEKGTILLTVNAFDKAGITPIAKRFHEMGFNLVATEGTANHLEAAGIPVSRVFKVHEGRPHGIDMIVNGDVQMLINTPFGKHALQDDYTLRQGRDCARCRVHDDSVGRKAACRCDSVAPHGSSRGEVDPGVARELEGSAGMA
jgi:carbamoyl-phosphate synthase large subunit